MKTGDRIHARRLHFAESNDHAVLRCLRQVDDGELDFDDEDRPRINTRTIVERARRVLRRWLSALGGQLMRLA